MKRTIRRSLYAGLIVFVSACLYLGGCQKKLISGEKAGAVQGYVRDSFDLSPIFGAEIWAGAPIDTTVITETDSSGYYTFTGFPMRINVTAKANGYESQTKTVEIIVNKTTEVDFFLNRKGGGK
ncbi:MAG: hypothetical protein GTO24_23530 [candidate division Zixibacteria bacterium]|nr:hypothetical protein [candidate division Zixibacteria bacterium]